MNSQSFFIHGKPVAQGRPRFFRRGAGVGAYDPETSAEWKQVVAWMARKEGARVMDGPLSVTMIFHMPRPKSLPKKTLHHVKKPDLDNLAKGVKDALKHICYHDDSQVVSLSLEKRYAIFSTGVEITIAEVSNG